MLSAEWQTQVSWALEVVSAGVDLCRRSRIAASAWARRSLRRLRCTTPMGGTPSTPTSRWTTGSRPTSSRPTCVPRRLIQAWEGVADARSQGHMMEKLLTTEPEQFSRFLVDSSDPAASEAENRQAYHYTMVRLPPFELFELLLTPSGRSRNTWFCGRNSTRTTSIFLTGHLTSRLVAALR